MNNPRHLAHKFPRLPYPTLVLLGNSTVRLYATQGSRLLVGSLIEIPLAVFLSRSETTWPAPARRLLTANRTLVVCSVQQAALRRVTTRACKFGQAVQVYGADFGPGLPVLLKPAAARTVGRDRLAGAVAARMEFPTGALVCDVGTALTINRVTSHGYEGGLIAPGVQLGLQALHAGTSQLPRVQAGPAVFPAKDTATAMRLGCLIAVAGAIEKIYRAEPVRPGGAVGRGRKPGSKGGVPASLPLILTGGSAIMIRPLLTLPALWRPHLVATGVWQAWQAR